MIGDDFTSAFQRAAFSIPEHVCDATCEEGEEVSERTFTRDDGSVCTVIGPRHEVESMTGPPSVEPTFPGEKSCTIHLPFKPGRERRTEILGQHQQDNPGSEVIVNCYGGTLIFPPHLRTGDHQGIQAEDPLEKIERLVRAALSTRCNGDCDFRCGDDTDAIMTAVREYGTTHEKRGDHQ